MAFEGLTEKLSSAFKKLRNKGRLTESDVKEAMREIRLALLEKVAICGGSGQSFYKEALAKGAQLYITGDIYYHTAQDMLSEGLLALDPGHHIEVLFVKKLVEKFQDWKVEEGWEVEFLASQVSTNPFKHI